MTPPDWHRLLSEFGTMWNPHRLAVARSLVRFLVRKSEPLTVDLLFDWLQDWAQHHCLESSMQALECLAPFLRFIETKGHCSAVALEQLRLQPDLLLRLGGLRRYSSGSPLEEPWLPIFTAFEASLRGLPPLEQGRMLRIASEFVATLPEKRTVCPTESDFLEWLDVQSQRLQFSTFAHYLIRVNRFLQFLMERGLCSTNPAAVWSSRRTTTGLREALRRRRTGEAALPGPARPLVYPELRSFLAPQIVAFVNFKRCLGRKYENSQVLKHLDGFLHRASANDWGALDEQLLTAFWGTFQHWQASTRKTSLGLLKQFLRFLERRGFISQERNLARVLPHVRRPPRLPYIYTVKEIAAILSSLKEDAGRHPFDRLMHFTLFHLVYACGLRISEPCRLQVRDVNFKEQTLFIRCTKFGKDRLIPLGRRAAEYLQQYHEQRILRFGDVADSAPFFVRVAGQPITTHGPRHVFGEARRRVGLVFDGRRPEPRIHDLRHSFAVHRLYKWYLEGVDPNTRLIFLSIYMGHVEPEHTQHYLNLSQDLLRIAGRPLERQLEAWLPGAGTPP